MFGYEMYLVLILSQFHFLTPLHLDFYPCENHNTNNEVLNVNCQRRRLAKIPKFESLSIISLNLDENHIRQIKSDAFSGMPNLMHLSLMWNCVPDLSKEKRRTSCDLTIHPDAFVGLQKLTSLHLAGNSLKTIPPLPEQLAVLGLEFNNIFHIDKPLGTPRLKHLLLSKNCFYANPCYQSHFIDPLVFQELPELSNLTLSYNNVTIVPPHLPLSLESLDLGENKITAITKESFLNLTRLRHLNLGWNCQRCDHASEPCFPCPNNQSLDLHQSAFSDQRDSLISLSLRGNSLRTLPRYLFAQLQKLQELDLSDNLLAYTIQNGTFYEELRRVVSLNLLYNYEPLNTFSELILSPSIKKMTALRELYLSGLFFRVLSNHSLAPLSKLPRLVYLELRMNFICSVNVSAFSQLRTLRRVGLSQNMLAFNPCIPFCMSKAIPKYLSHRGHQKHELDLQFEKLSLPNTELWLNTVLSSKGGDYCPLYYSMWHLKKEICSKHLMFDLSQNNIPWLNSSTFIGMEEAVCIDLSYNYISQSLNGQQFSHLSKLAYLNMAHNRIDLYSDRAFQELSDTLQVLDLSNNEFHFAMKGMGHRFTFLSHLSSLQMLSLANNHIGLRISNILKSNSLKSLIFSGNRLDIMWDSRRNEYTSFFQGLTNLTHLDISENKLKSFSPEVFVNLPPTLRVLRVDSNMLSYFPWGNISALKDLCYLNLSENMLSFLPSNHFELNLISLDLSHNRLIAIPRAFFSRAKYLKDLMLNHNQLKFLNVQALPWSFHKTHTICGSEKHKNASCKLVLHANPFTCSCVTSEFAKFLRETNLNVPHLTTHIHCAYPESLAGVNVLSIDLRSCQEVYGSFAFLCTSLLTLAGTIIPLLKHLYGWDLWYCIQILWTGHKGHTPANGNTSDSHYDAFVVFDTSDKAVRDWIYNEMIERLEHRGRWRFRLCLEERDWLPGVSCIENLHKAVYNSRKTVFVLTSPSGYSQASGVVKQAFLLVQQRLLDEKVDVAVLVLLDLLFPKFKYLQMRKRLCKKSVLSWPRNPRAQPLFWNNLSVALLSDNVREYNKNVTESFV
ncbi:toll-like receptor 9 [Paramisgurnus dabryanus]|uniref:toll-like receptor 9 n=1 Tax=Paramisgurnus dabryanus TaxID=90735 RepID=UPI0031F458EC